MIPEILMGTITDSMFNSPADIEKFNLNIVDKDNTTYSENLKNYIKNDLNGLVNIVNNKKDSNIEILIPGDYSSNVESKTPSNIYIKEIDDKNRDKSTIISGVLDNYHEMLYLNKVNATDNYNFEQIFNKKALDTEYIKPDIMPNSYEFYALSLLGFLVIMMIMSNAVNAHLDQYTGLYKRTYSLPVSRVELLFHNTLSIFLYSFIFPNTTSSINRRYVRTDPILFGKTDEMKLDNVATNSEATAESQITTARLPLNVKEKFNWREI